MNRLEARKQVGHHYFFSEREPQSLVEVRFKACENLIEPVRADVKELVETRLEAPIEPTIEEMIGCMTYLDRVCPQNKSKPFWRGMNAMQYFVYAGATNPDREPECADIRYSVAKQIGFLSLNLPDRFVERYL